MPILYIIAGSNGAGKTTAACSLLPGVFETVEFVNADEIAKGLSPFNPEGAAILAGRIMLERMEELISKQVNFTFETTLSGLSHLRFIELARSFGYSIVLLFIYLSSPELAKKRVQVRVSKGGHNIAPEIVERRYYKGLKNFPLYATAANNWYMYNNSGPEFSLVAKKIDESEDKRQAGDKKRPGDISGKIRLALDKAIEKIVIEEKMRNGYLVVADNKGMVKKMPASEL